LLQVRIAFAVSGNVALERKMLFEHTNYGQAQSASALYPRRNLGLVRDTIQIFNRLA